MSALAGQAAPQHRRRIETAPMIVLVVLAGAVAWLWWTACGEILPIRRHSYLACSIWSCRLAGGLAILWPYRRHRFFAAAFRSFRKAVMADLQYRQHRADARDPGAFR